MNSISALSVLHFCPRPSYSGLEAYALDMAAGQQNLGARIQFVVLKDSPLAEKCKARSIKTIEIGSDLVSRWVFRGQLARLLRSGEIDIVHLHSTQDLDLVLLSLAVSHFAVHRPRVILQTHIWISHSKKDPLHAIAYSLVDEVWCSSLPAQATLRKFLPISAAKIRVLNYGREVEKMEKEFLTREAARLALGLPLNATVIGAVARIDKGKGTGELLEAALEAMRTHPDLHLILIGPPTADDPKALAFGKRILERISAQPLSLRERLHALGAVAESYRYLKAFDLNVLATYQECFALSLLEALLAGVPTLATNSGGSPEVVKPAETGWLFEPRSTKSLLASLEQALRERARWPAMGENGRQRVQRDFDFPRILPTTLAAYKEVLLQR